MRANPLFSPDAVAACRHRWFVRHSGQREALDQHGDGDELTAGAGRQKARVLLLRLHGGRRPGAVHKFDYSN